MVRWHFPSWLTLVRTVARGLAWVNDIVAIVVLCFVAQKWTDTCGAVAPGIVGAVIALLNDSWQMVAFADRTLGFEPMKPHRTLMHDIFSLAVTLGGIVLMLVSNVQSQDADELVSYIGADGGGIKFHRSTMTWIGTWLLTIVIAFRIGFAIWACMDCYKEYQQEARRHLRQTDVEQVEA